ncbi:MAG: M23 family metallopeptidase [Desulfotomaculum sp.]|nr:M23 family metallopeptidase [Desulfotomaculum sp.]
MSKGKLKKRLPSFTLMLVPHSDHQIYKFRIPPVLIKICLVLFACITALTIYFSVRYLQMKEELVELKDLRKINTIQAAKLKTIESETMKLKEQMTELKNLEKDVREMIGRESVSSRSRPLNSRKIVETSSYHPGDNAEKIPLLDLINRKSYREKKLEWDKRYLTAASISRSLLAETGEVKRSLELLKKDVAARKAYLAARPSGLPARGRISSGYGYRRSPFTGRKDFHPGIDIAAPYGEPVVATGKGKVVFVGYKAGYGKTVIIDHSFGFRTVYAHNSKIKVEVGDTVTRGECIALVGSTGSSTGPHLHYEVIKNGVRVDPADYIQ